MTKFLLRIFVPETAGLASGKARTAIGKLSGTVGTVCNLLLFAAKLMVGLLAGSVSVMADALNNLSDAISSVVTLIGFKLAEKPADADHPYGHARYEYLSGLAVAAMIIVIGVELGRSSIEKIFAPSAVIMSDAMFIVLAVSVLLKLWLSHFNRSLGKQIESSALMATSADSRNDAISTGAVLLAAVLERFFHWQLDGWMGLAVAAFILWSGVGLAKDTISPLLGETASPELRKLILDVVRSDKLVLGYHDLMVHDYGPGQRFASIHVEMDGAIDPILCHEHIDHLERECLEQQNVHLVIHYDPLVTGDKELNTIRETVYKFFKEYDARISMHDFRMIRRDGYTQLLMDAALPPEMMAKRDAVQQYLEEKLAGIENGKYRAVVTYDLESFQ